MGRSKKPGAPGKTTVPPEIVASVTARLLAVFRERGYDTDHDLFIVPQQCFLYVEAQRKLFGSRSPAPPVTTSSTAHKPLGRLKYLGNAEEWEWQPYLWTDEFWTTAVSSEGRPSTDARDAMLLKLP